MDRVAEARDHEPDQWLIASTGEWAKGCMWDTLCTTASTMRFFFFLLKVRRLQEQRSDAEGRGDEGIGVQDVKFSKNDKFKK